MKYEILEGGVVVNTIIANEEFMAQNYEPSSYRLVVETEVPAPPPPPAPEPEWAWLIDHGSFADRLGHASAAIDLSTNPGVIVIRTDFSRRKWIDLKDPRVLAALMYLAGQPHPVLGTLATPLITVDIANAAVNTKPLPSENLALRKAYFS